MRKELFSPATIAAVIILLVVIAFAAFSSFRGRAATSSSELTFTSSSAHGLDIVPASCAASPFYPDAPFSASGDGLGYISTNGTDDGSYDPRTGQYICITNNTGYSIFVPGNSASEINYMRSYPPGGAAVYVYP